MNVYKITDQCKIDAINSHSVTKVLDQTWLYEDRGYNVIFLHSK
jgi:hypothetical protein